MKTERKIILIVTFFVALTVFLSVVFFTQHAHDNHIEDVTMIQLIATPERYHGKLVRVIGVGNIEFEGNYIAIDKEAYEHLTGDRIWIDLDSNSVSYDKAAQYNGEYVIVEGIFDKNDRGHMSMFCGSIKNVNRYEAWGLLKDTAE